MEIISIVVLIFLVFISILDWRFKAVPSIFMTGMLFAVAIVNYQNILFGALAFIFAILLTEFEIEGKSTRGVADTKATVIVGLMVATIPDFLLYVGLIAIFQLVYVIALRAISKERYIPFLPVYAIVYIVMMLVGIVK